MANTYLTRTTGTPTNAKKWTLSFWVKISADFSTAEDVVYTGTDGSNEVLLHRYETDGTLACKEDTSAQNSVFTYTNSEIKFRDCNAWQHWVYAYDSTQSTDTNRLKVYINGVDRRTVETLTADTKPPLNHEPILNKSGYTFGFGRRSYDGSNYFKGLLSHVHFIDGVQYDASTFGSTDSTTGEWKINTSPTISDYGNNGFFILKDGNSVTDQSGKGNNFTAYGTLTKTEDCPSNVFATWNPLSTNTTLSSGNTESELGSPGSGYHTASSTLAMTSGKFYMECKVTVQDDYPSLGICRPSSPHATKLGNNWLGDDANSYGFYVGTGSNFYHNNSNVGSIGTTLATNDVLGMALDLDSAQNTLKLYKNGSLISTQNIIDSDDGWMFATTQVNGKASARSKANFGNGYFRTTAVSSAGTNASGNGIFEYDCPSGYTALSTKGLNL